MSYMSEYLLKNILSFEDSGCCAYLFTNANPELIYQISNYVNSLEKNNLITLSISTNELNLPNIESFSGIEDKGKLAGFKKILYENLIVGLLLDQLYKKYPDLKIPKFDCEMVKKGIMQSLKSSYDEINFNNILFSQVLEYAANEFKRKGINIAINVYISDDNNILLQKTLNDLLNDRHTYNTRFFTTLNGLITYYDANGIMQEETHDYHERNLKGISFSKQK